MTRVAPPAAGFRAELSRLAELSRQADRSRRPSSDAGGSEPLLLAACRLPASIDPLDLWDAAPPAAFAGFWEHEGETLAAIGETPEAAGTARRRPREKFTDGAVQAASSGARPPRRLGSVPFAEGWTDDDWRPLTAAGFALPRWTLHRPAPGGPVELTLAVRGPLAESDLEAIETEFGAIRRALELAGPRRALRLERPGVAAGRPESPAASSSRGRAEWDASVGAALREIEAGRLEKVVLARRLAEPLPAGLAAPDLLRVLRAEGSGTFRFGLRRAGKTFLGASPECLFAKTGDAVEVEALAGTYDLGAGVSGSGSGPASAGSDARPLVRAAEHLFASGKDLEEHALVVRGVVEALEPLALSVAPDDWPRVREARRLAHLSTTVRATVRPDVTALDLIAALHPTPAVGGLPRKAAIEFIRETESAPRGLFAAPVGWIGPDGDACLAVGIRSALVLETHALVYAGAGIVRASEAAAEWDETTAKLRWLRELVAAAGSAG